MKVPELTSQRNASTVLATDSPIGPLRVAAGGVIAADVSAGDIFDIVATDF